MSALRVPAIIGVYLGLNFVLNFGNKHLLGQFSYPIFVILAGTLCYAPLSGLLIVASSGSFPSWPDKRALRSVLVIGVVHAVGTTAQNYSLSRRSMTIGLNQVIKACTPAVTLVFSWLLQRCWFHWSLIVSTVFVVAGTVLTTFASSEATFNGVASSAVSAVFGGLEGVLIDMLMTEHKLDAAQVTLMTSIPAAASLAALFFAVEFSPAFVEAVAGRGTELLGAVALLSVSAAAYTYCHILLIGATSAHYCNLVGSVKLAILVGISLFVVDRSGHPVTLLNTAGVVLTLAAFCCYSVCRTYFPERKGGDG